MPINKQPGESKDEFISRCISIEIKDGKPQDQAAAICYAKWEEFAEVGKRGAIVESPKAPKSDTPNRNPKGEGTAKGDASGKRGAEVTPRVEEILRKKVDEFNDRYKEKLGYGVDIGVLKTVYQRGVGAYNVSHSPRVQSAEQWALARVNAFLYIIKNGRPENPKYVNDNDLLPDKHPKSEKSQEKKEEKMKSATASVTDNTWSTEAPISIELDSYRDYPEAAKRNAQVALDWAEQNGWGDCGTPVGKQRANQLAKGEPISRDTIARMAAFERHRQNSNKELGDGCGRLMWQAWGGDEGIEWAKRKLEQLDKENLSSIYLEKISIDYDETLTTDRGMQLAKRLIREGNDVYIISARRDKQSMLTRAKELGIPADRVFATGSNREKANKVKELGIKKHYDNNRDVVNSLPGVGQNFRQIRRVLFDEDFTVEQLEDIKRYKELGFKVYVKSKRKIKKADKKLWNKLRVAGLSEDNLLFGDIPELDKRYDFESIEIGEDPLLEKLLATAKSITGKHVIETFDIENMQDAENTELKLSNMEIKFRTVKVYYTYELRDDVNGNRIIPTTRDFCRRLLEQEGRAWTLDQIKNLSGAHLVKMGLPNDPFQFRGGFYRVKGTLNTTPFCRHIWKAKIVIE